MMCCLFYSYKTVLHQFFNTFLLFSMYCYYYVSSKTITAVGYCYYLICDIQTVSESPEGDIQFTCKCCGGGGMGINGCFSILVFCCCFWWTTTATQSWLLMAT